MSDTHSLLQGVDSVLLNANIITVDDERPSAEAVAIHNGKFVAAGRTQEIKELAGSGTEVFDLAGKTVVPGFIDAHIHVMWSGIRHLLAVDCGFDSLEDIKRALRERARSTPKGEWVLGFKFDDTKTRERRFLNRRDLDEADAEHPIIVVHRGGHNFFLNNRALEALDISDDNPPPPGGKYGRDPQTGKLTGYVSTPAVEKFFAGLLAGATSADRRRALRMMCGMFNQAGITSVHDAIVHPEDVETYQEGLENHDLSLRIYMLVWHTHLSDLLRMGVRTGFGNDMLKFGGVKFCFDGAISGRTAYLAEPYEGSTDDRGLLAMSPEELEEGVMKAHRAGLQPCTHANGDAAIEIALTIYEKALAAWPRKDPRMRIEHCTVVNPNILGRLKKLGCVVTPFCTYVYHHGEKMRYYGEERLERMFAQRSFLDNGIISAGATDYLCGPFEPLLGIQSCVTRTDSSGKTWGPSQKITVDEALKIYTLHGAYASFEENLKGSITPGKLADAVVLSADPRTVDPFAIRDIPVEKTIVGGRVVYDSSSAVQPT